jgi:hypothetical protein
LSIKALGYFGFGLPLLLWLGLLALLFKYGTGGRLLRGARAAAHGNRFVVNQQPASRPQTPSLDAPHEHTMRQRQRINEQSARERASPPTPDPWRESDLNPAPPVALAPEYEAFDLT